MINPNLFGLTEFDIPLAMCDPTSVPLFLVGIMPISGVGLASKMAYGWVERCNNVAGCGTRFFQDKYSCLLFSATIYVFMN